MSRVPYPAQLAALAVLYAAVARLGLMLDAVSGFATLVWPATGLALAALYRFGLRLWPAVWVGAAVVNWATGAPLAVACGIATGNALEAILGAALLRRAGFCLSLERVRDVLALGALAAVAATVVSATVGVASLALGGLVPPGAVAHTWRAWWLGDLVGVLVVAAPLFAWGSALPRLPRGRRRALEATGLAAVLLATAALVFLTPPDVEPAALHQVYFLYLPLVWAALRFDSRTVTLALLAVSAIGVAGTTLGAGPWDRPSLHENLTLLQAFMAVLAITILLLRAVTAERAEALASEQRARARGRLAEERFAFLANASAAVNARLDEAGLVRLSRLIVPFFADWCVLELDDDDGEPRRAVVTHDDPARADAVRALEQVVPVSRALPADHTEVRRTGRALLRAGVTPAWLDAQLAEPAHRVLVRELGATSSVHVPLRSSESVLGVFSLFRGARARPFDGDDLAVAEDLARRAAQAAAAARELRRTEESRRLLGEADRRKSEFLAMLSHELRNPMAPIRSSVFVLERSPPGGEPARRALAIVDRQVQHMTRLIDDLLDVSRIARGKLRIVRDRLDLVPLLRGVLEDHRAQFDERGVRLEASLPDGPLLVEGDPTRLAQMVGNLLQNAAKFTPPGGRASLSLARGEAGRAIVRVRDDGAGIAPETLARLFEPFVQADRTLARSHGGLGLGLALVRGIAELHGGTVSARSEGPGRGAEFIVSVPALAVAARQAPGAAERPRPSAPPGAAHRVLLIEDNVDAAESLQEALALGGHEVAVAFTGPEGLARARAFHPDVVLCDIGLPGIDGYEVARRMRADPALRAIHLIALSGYARPEDIELSWEAGFDDHLAKPLSVEAIEARLGAPPRAPRDTRPTLH